MSLAIPEVLRGFVAEARALWREPMDDEARWCRIAALAPRLLQSPALRDKARSWPAPAPDRTRPCNLLFYEDPDYGFVINALIKRPQEGTAVHDHAHTWTVYGVLAGEERILRYRRIDDGTAPGRARLEQTGDTLVRSGFVDLVPPGLIHAEYAGDAPTIAVIIRSERVGGFAQNMFDPQSGRITQAPGPEQIFYAL